MISEKQKAISYKKQIIGYSGYKKLIAWQKSDELAKGIYKATANFPKNEVFGITSQLRRAALSVPANIIEGYSRVNRNEFRRFLSIALGSLAEVEYFLSFSFEIDLLKKSDYEYLINLKEECGRIIWKLYLSQK